MKKILSVILCLCMLLAVMPMATVSAIAETANDTMEKGVFVVRKINKQHSCEQPRNT